MKSGFLHCAAHDETVSSFGRNDGSWGWGKKDNGNCKGKMRGFFATLRMTSKRGGKGKCAVAGEGGVEKRISPLRCSR